MWPTPGASPPGDRFSWSFGGGVPAAHEGPDPPEVCFPAADTYELALSVGNAVDTLSAARTVVVLPRPAAVTGTAGPIGLNFGEELVLAPCAEGLDYAWRSRYPLSCADCPAPLLRAVGNDTLLLEVSSGGRCPVGCRYVVRVEVPDQVYLPTAFSPNGDGRNDRFGPLGPYHEAASLRVFDRWGGLLHDGRPPDARWDGSAAGRPAPTGTYVYVLVYRDTRDGSVRQVSGEVTLVR